MHKAVGERLPQPTMKKVWRAKCQQRGQGIAALGGNQSGKQEREVGAEVDQNQLARGAAEAWKGKRTGADSAHRIEQGIRSEGSMSWEGSEPARSLRIEARSSARSCAPGAGY